MFSPSAIVNVWCGGMKNQLTSRKPPTAAASAGQSPPTAATATTRSRKRSITLGSSSVVAELREHERRAAAAPTAASSEAEQLTPAARERRGPPRARDDERLLGARLGWLMTWTSIATPDSRITLPITEPRVSRCQRERRVAPITIWVAFSERAASSERLADVGADDLVVGAAELLDELALLCEQLGRRRREPVLRDDVHGDEVALRALRDPRGAADEPLAVGRAGERDEHALARLPRLARSRAGGGTRRAPRRRGRRARRARARAARRGCPGRK